jgi:pyruvate/2-oxoacid:ferredoxin oxidoreductase beta subunit
MDFTQIPNIEYMNSGHLGCPGCGATMSMRHALKILGENTVIVMPASCWSIIAGGLPMTALQVPLMHVPFAVAAACASGVSQAYKYQNRDDINVVVWAGES